MTRRRSRRKIARIRRAVLLALSSVVLLAVGGCGGDDEESDRKEIGRVVIESVDASHAGDARRACPLYTRAYVRELLRENRRLRPRLRTCEGYVEGIARIRQQLAPTPNPRVSRFRLAGDRARARLEIKTEFGPAASEIFLVRDGDSWKIDHDEDVRPAPARGR